MNCKRTVDTEQSLLFQSKVSRFIHLALRYVVNVKVKFVSQSSNLKAEIGWVWEAVRCNTTPSSRQQKPVWGCHRPHLYRPPDKLSARLLSGKLSTKQNLVFLSLGTLTSVPTTTLSLLPVHTSYLSTLSGLLSLFNISQTLLSMLRRSTESLNVFIRERVKEIRNSLAFLLCLNF